MWGGASRPHLGRELRGQLERLRDDEKGSGMTGTAATTAMTTTAPAAGPRSPLYRHVVADARRALSLVEIGQIAGASERAVQNWASGASSPEGLKRDRLLELKYVIEELSDVYTDEGVEIWLHGRQKSLGGRRPLDLLRDGEFEAVLAAVERLAGGPRRT